MQYKTTLTYTQVQASFPDAWDALPEPYKNDSCLTFYTSNSSLYAIFDLGGVYMWQDGRWADFFNYNA